MKRQEAADEVVRAKAGADIQRRDVHKRQIAEVDKQDRRVRDQREVAETVKANGASNAKEIERKARDQKAARVFDANQRLADARSERSKH